MLCYVKILHPRHQHDATPPSCRQYQVIKLRETT